MSQTINKLGLPLFGVLALTMSTATCNTNVLLDDFNDGDFAGWTVNHGQWSVTNSTLFVHGTGAGTDGEIYTGDGTWSDFIFEGDVLFQTGNANIFFRSTGSEYNEYRFELWSEDSEAYSNRFHVRRTRDGVHTIFTASLPGAVDGNILSPVPITSNSRFRVEAIGSLMRFYVNDTEIFVLDDPDPLTSGQVGLGVIWFWDTSYDNVSVTLIPEISVIGALVPCGLLIVAAGRMRRKKNRSDLQTSV